MILEVQLNKRLIIIAMTFSKILNYITRIPGEILNLHKMHSDCSITLDIFNKYRFYKKYCSSQTNDS